MELGPIIRRYQSRIRIHGSQALIYRRQGLDILAGIENGNRVAAIADLTRVLRMAEREATKAVRKTHLDRLPF